MIEHELTTIVQGFDGRELSLKANIFVPDGKSSGLLFFCLPGGGASRDYFDMGMVGSVDYSFVSHMTAIGHTVITMDHPGTGTNPLPEGHLFLKPRTASDYLAAAFEQICSDEDLEDLDAIGVGHSMGGMTTTLLQARHNCFSGVALLGSSARGLDWGTTEEEKTYVGKPDALERDLEKLVLARYGSAFPEIAAGPSGKSITFGGANPQITEQLRNNMVSLYAAGGTTSMIKGSFAMEAAAIAVPIFFAFGDHDIGAPPEEAPQDYPNAADIELHILENCGHNSFAFPVIEELCSKLDQWARKTTG